MKIQCENELENQKLAELRDWLLVMLMNGQVRVGDATKYEMGGEELGMVPEDRGKYRVLEIRQIGYEIEY